VHAQSKLPKTAGPAMQHDPNNQQNAAFPWENRVESIKQLNKIISE